MIKAILAFLIVFGIMYVAIPSYRSLTGREKWDVVKLVSYSVLCAIISILVLSGIVILF